MKRYSARPTTPRHAARGVSGLGRPFGRLLGRRARRLILLPALVPVLFPASALAVPAGPAIGLPPLPPAASASPPGDESWWNGFDTQGTNGRVLAFALFDDELVAGGEFTTAGGAPAPYIARWDGDSWSPLGSGMNAPVHCLAVHDGDLIAGGEFTIAGGIAATYIARWNGSSWGPVGTGMDDAVHAFTIFKGDLFAGGDFELAGGASASRVACWDGSTWTALDSGLDDSVLALTAYNGELIAGGAFTMSGTTPVSHIARWQGMVWSGFGTGANDTVRSLAITSFLFAGGDFTSMDGVPANRIARWNRVNWFAMGAGVVEGTGGTVNAMLVYTGKLIVGGLFDHADNGQAENIAAWDLFSTSWSPLGSGLVAGTAPETRALAVYHGSLYAGGNFQMAGGNTSLNIARWTYPITFDALGVTLESNRAPHELSPGSSLGNDIWGYVSPSGREYAMIGLTNGVAFVEVTDPRHPIHIKTIPHTSSTWADVKPFDQYAYIVADGTNEGMQIVDLTQIDSGSVELFGSFRGSGLTRAHTIGVNSESGYVYLFGGNLGDVYGGILAIDVSKPTHPAIAGLWDEHYVHDAQVVSYLSGPNAGREIAFAATTDSGLTIVDVTDKANMFTVSRLVYPNATYCHQGWLSDDRRYFFIDDELDELTGHVPFTTTHVVDVSDIENPQLATTFTNGLKAVDHDLMVRGNLVVEANYTSGLRIYDATDIADIHEVAYFDTYPEDNEPTFNGAWGPYTGLPSGIVLVSDRHRGLFVFSLTPGTGIADPVQPAPATWSLAANYPNPFHRETSIGFELPQHGRVRLTIFSVLGRPVRTLLEGPLAPGPHAVIWDGRDDGGMRIPGGVYWYRLETPAAHKTQRMVLIP